MPARPRLLQKRAATDRSCPLMSVAALTIHADGPCNQPVTNGPIANRIDRVHLHWSNPRHGPLSRPVSLHPQLGPQHHGGSSSHLLGRGSIRSLQCRQPSDERGASARAPGPRKPLHSEFRTSQQELGRICDAHGAAPRLRIHRLRSCGPGGLSGMARPADDGALGHCRPRSRGRIGRKTRTRLRPRFRELSVRIQIFTSLRLDALDELALKRQLEAIGKTRTVPNVVGTDH
jgi:hypothetical protein